MRPLLVVALLSGALGGCGGAPEPARRDPSGDPLASVPAAELVDRGRAFATAGDHARALEYYRAAILRGAPADDVAPLLIDAAVASQRYREALQYAAPVLEREPMNWRLRYLVANLHLGLGDERSAEEELGRILELAPEAPEPHYLLARILGDQAGRAAEARPLYQRYVELAPAGDHAATARRWLAAHPTDLPPAPASSHPAPPPAATRPAGASATNPTTNLTTNEGAR